MPTAPHNPAEGPDAPAGAPSSTPPPTDTTSSTTNPPPESAPAGTRAPAEASPSGTRAPAAAPLPDVTSQVQDRPRTKFDAQSDHSVRGQRVSADHPEALVRQFHRAFHLPIVDWNPEDPPSLDRERVHLRMALVAEEFAELMGAVYGPTAQRTMAEAFTTAVGADERTRDVVGAADALGDLVYVIYGMALECGIPLANVLAQVQASNMSKLGADGTPIYREDGKVLKGPGYFPPDVAEALGLGGAE